MKKTNETSKPFKPNHSHAWRGSWNRPMYLDEDALHPFTVARMTDHNVKGSDKDEPKDLDSLPNTLKVKDEET